MLFCCTIYTCYLLTLFLWILTKALWSGIWDLWLAVSKMTQIIPASYLISFRNLVLECRLDLATDF